MSDLVKLAGILVFFMILMFGVGPELQQLQVSTSGSGSSSWLGVLVLVMLIRFARDNR